MSFLKSGKHSILVTGGSSGIGLELARCFVNLGHEVIAVSRSQEKLDKAKQSCPQLITFIADTSNENGRQALHAKIQTDFPQVDVLINNAGANLFPRNLAQTQQEDWEKCLYELNT